MSDQDFIDDTLKPKRSTFLTILCILTFVGSGYGILSGLASYVMFQNGTMQKIQQNQVKTVEKIKEDKSQKNQFAEKVMENSMSMLDPEKMKLSTIFQLIASVLTLTGGLLMFKQKIAGYGIYIAGCLLAIGGIVYIYGTSNFIVAITGAVSGLFSLVFIILYGMCVKEMLPNKSIA